MVDRQNSFYCSYLEQIFGFSNTKMPFSSLTSKNIHKNQDEKVFMQIY